MKRWMMLAAAVLFVNTAVQAATFELDPYHSSVSFRIKHLVGKVPGKFDKFTGTITYDAGKLANAAVTASIEAASVNTGIEKRDNHLRTAEFFDVAKYPTLTFKSDKVTDVQGNKAKVAGVLTMHGVSKPVVLDVELSDLVDNPMTKGKTLGGSAKTTVNRNDFGIGPKTGPSSAMIGEQVEIQIDFEANSK